MRIAHFLARCGVASRRAAEDIVAAGRVTINGEPVTTPGTKVSPATDIVCVDGKPRSLATNHVTLAMNKPLGVMVTREDPDRRRTVYDLLPPEFRRRSSELVYAGRLDYNTSGLLVLSTDGELVNRLTHPRHLVDKTYETRLNRALTDDEVRRLSEGDLEYDGFKPHPARIEFLRHTSGGPVYEVTIHEGKNRQVRRMFEALGARVEGLRRVAIGQLRLRALEIEEGAVVELDRARVALLLRPALPATPPADP